MKNRKNEINDLYLSLINIYNVYRFSSKNNFRKSKIKIFYKLES